MPEGTSNSILSLGDLAKPADTLIRKVSDAVGGIYQPFQIVRIAKANARADLITAQNEIEVEDLHRRAMARRLAEDALHQKNIEDIIRKALPHLGEDSDPSKMDDDWIANFFAKSRIVADSEMQEFWARILAGESNKHGTYAKRTINFLSDIDKSDAELFTSLCGYCWDVDGVVPIVFDERDEIYNRNGIDFDTLMHLGSIGLIQYNAAVSIASAPLPKVLNVSYYSHRIELHMQQESDNSLLVGKCMLTKVGKELASICGSGPVDGFMEYVQKRWIHHWPKPKAEHENGGN